jgi:hypothetical protein
MKITPPFGYPEIAALNKSQRVTLPKPGEAPDFCRRLNALPVSYSEFARASHDYPLVFISGDNGKTFGAVAVLGLQNGQNLFVDAAGAWDKSVYLPAYMRRYPFCMAKVNVDNVTKNERIVCVAQHAISETNGEALFDEKGGALPRWVEMEKLLHEYEADLIRTEEMCGILKEHDLLEPFTMQAVSNAGDTKQLAGMHRVAESRLEALAGDPLRTLIKKGVMGRIYAHLLSLDNFSRLLDRSVGAQHP